jgi:hypothetical protein
MSWICSAGCHTVKSSRHKLFGGLWALRCTKMAKWANIIQMVLNTQCKLSHNTRDTELHLPSASVLAAKLPHISMPQNVSLNLLKVSSMSWRNVFDKLQGNTSQKSAILNLDMFLHRWMRWHTWVEKSQNI